MDSMEQKLNSILSDPSAMEKIMAMAQSLGDTQQTEKASQQSAETVPEMDIGMLKKISGLAGQGNIDQDQRALLRALSPYLSRQRIYKLENAMRAAKMAKIAATLLPQGAKFPIGR